MILTMNRDHEVRTPAEPYRDMLHLDTDPRRFMPRNRTAPVKLPLDFKPTPYSVIVGRGKLCTESVGNRRLRVLATTFLQTYSHASRSKLEKTTSVSRIVEITQEACPVGAFIKLDGDGRWWECDDHTAREKVGYIIRDLLGDKYRSSSKSKVVARRRRSSGVSPRRDESMTPPSSPKKEQGGNKDRRKPHARRHSSAAFRESPGPATSLTTSTAPSRPSYNIQEKKDLVVGVYGSTWPRNNDLDGLEHTKKYTKKNPPPKSIQSDLKKKKSSKAQEDHLLVLAGAAAEMTDFSSLSLDPQERNAYARAASRSWNPASTLPTSGDFDGKYSGSTSTSYSTMFARAAHIPSHSTSILPSSCDLDQRYSADSMFAHAARSPMRASIFPSSGHLEGGKYPDEQRPFYDSNHLLHPAASGAVPFAELGGSNEDNFLSFLDQHMPSPVPSQHAGALSRSVHQANGYASSPRIGGDPSMLPAPNSVYREFDSRAPRNEEYPTQAFLRQPPPIFNFFNRERLEFRRRREEPTTPLMEYGGSLGDAACASNRHLWNQQQPPNLLRSNPRSSSSSQEAQQGPDEYYHENISNIFD